MEYLELLKDLASLAKLVNEVRKVKRKPRLCSVRKIYRDRHTKGYYKVSFLKMKKYDPEQFYKQCRMNEERFDFLLSLIRDRLQKKSIRKPISPRFRLALTLSHLSQGVPVQYLAWSYKVGKETARQIIIDTCEQIWEVLFPIYVGEANVNDINLIMRDYQNLWSLPHCVGSIDGKHISIQKPRNSGALFYNYRKFYSIVLLAACDARYMFTFVDVGGYGGNSDGGLFINSKFGKKILKQELPLPAPKPLPNSEHIVPAFFIADAAFPLGLHLMKPYSGNNLSGNQERYNKVICGARQTIENAFGILAARWRILLNTIRMEPPNAEKVVLACLALHNFIMMDNYSRNQYYSPSDHTDWIDENGVEHSGRWRDEVQPLTSIQRPSAQRRFNGLRATEIRNTLCAYFNK